jgi:hypothetical protein
MRDPTDPFEFPELPDAAGVAIDNFLSEFQMRFHSYYFAQKHRYYQD